MYHQHLSCLYQIGQAYLLPEITSLIVHIWLQLEQRLPDALNSKKWIIQANKQLAATLATARASQQEDCTPLTRCLAIAKGSISTLYLLLKQTHRLTHQWAIQVLDSTSLQTIEVWPIQVLANTAHLDLTVSAAPHYTLLTNQTPTGFLKKKQHQAYGRKEYANSLHTVTKNLRPDTLHSKTLPAPLINIARGERLQVHQDGSVQKALLANQDKILIAISPTEIKATRLASLTPLQIRNTAKIFTPPENACIAPSASQLQSSSTLDEDRLYVLTHPRATLHCITLNNNLFVNHTSRNFADTIRSLHILDSSVLATTEYVIVAADLHKDQTLWLKQLPQPGAYTPDESDVRYPAEPHRTTWLTLDSTKLLAHSPETNLIAISSSTQPNSLTQPIQLQDAQTDNQERPTKKRKTLTETNAK